MSRIRERLKARGYSLLEMVVAGFIFSAVSVALAGVFSFHYQAIGSSRLFLIAQYLAREKMDEFVAGGYEKAPEVAGTAGATPVDVTFSVRKKEATDPDNITVRFLVEDDFVDVTKIDPNDFRSCTVTVSWTEANRTRNVRYNVLLSREV